MPSLASYIVSDQRDQKNKPGTIGRFTSTFGLETTKVLNKNIPAKIQKLMTLICRSIKTNALHMGALTFKNICGMVAGSKEPYDDSEILVAMQQVVNTYPNLDKKMQLSFEQKTKEIHFKRIE